MIYLNIYCIYIIYIYEPFPQTADLGGWLVIYITMVALHRELDKDPTKDHEFLAQRQVLLDQKLEDPRCRITIGKNPFNKMESVNIVEKRNQGLKAPRMRFCELEIFRAKFGEPAPEKVKTQVFAGKDFMDP